MSVRVITGGALRELAQMARDRIQADAPLLAEVTA